VWKSAVDSLTEARKYVISSPEARSFLERYMRKVLQCLLEQVPQNIGNIERNCVQKSLLLGVLISVDDLNIKSDAAAGDSTMLAVLALIFNKKWQFYKGSKWKNNMNGLPEVRMLLVDRFKSMHGFERLGAYLEARIGTLAFPPPMEVKVLLDAARDAVPGSKFEGGEVVKKALEDDIIRVSKAVMKDMEEPRLEQQSEDVKKIMLHEVTVRWSLQRIIQCLICSRRKEAYEMTSMLAKLLQNEKEEESKESHSSVLRSSREVLKEINEIRSTIKSFEDDHTIAISRKRKMRSDESKKGEEKKQEKKIKRLGTAVETLNVTLDCLMKELKKINDVASGPMRDGSYRK